MAHHPSQFTILSLVPSIFSLSQRRKRKNTAEVGGCCWSTFNRPSLKTRSAREALNSTQSSSYLARLVLQFLFLWPGQEMKEMLRSLANGCINRASKRHEAMLCLLMRFVSPSYIVKDVSLSWMRCWKRKRRIAQRTNRTEIEQECFYRFPDGQTDVTC